MCIHKNQRSTFIKIRIISISVNQNDGEIQGNIQFQNVFIHLSDNEKQNMSFP
jgi:hypothetical protein